jgi:AcrR family transcriptional regulator
MGSLPGTSERRKAQILDAATTVFVRHGFQQARMDDIAAAVGLSKPALYLYFTSKEAIVTELMRRLFDVEVEELHHLERAEGTVSQRLLAFNDGVQRSYAAMAVRAPLMWEFYALAMRDKSVRTLVRGYFGTLREQLESLIRQGVSAGEFRFVDPRATAITFLAVYEGLGILWAADPHNISWKEQADTAVALVLDGLRSRPACQLGDTSDV